VELYLAYGGTWLAGFVGLEAVERRLGPGFAVVATEPAEGGD